MYDHESDLVEDEVPHDAGACTSADLKSERKTEMASKFAKPPRGFHRRQLAPAGQQPPKAPRLRREARARLTATTGYPYEMQNPTHSSHWSYCEQCGKLQLTTGFGQSSLSYAGR